jgi:hypothetical protein
VNGYSSNWFHKLACKSSLICFKEGRIKFIDKNQVQQNQPAKANVFFYLDRNDNHQSFENVFKNIGTIVSSR